mgnify:CR=1 FL=1
MKNNQNKMKIKYPNVSSLIFVCSIALFSVSVWKFTVLFNKSDESDSDQDYNKKIIGFIIWGVLIFISFIVLLISFIYVI